MNVLDVNVLVALYRPDHLHHVPATEWWQASSGSGEPFTVADLVWVGFVRVVTNRRIFEEAATFDAAWQFVAAMRGAPTYRRPGVDAGAMEQFARLGREVGASGTIVADTYIAATAAAYGGTVVTFDRDFRKFDGLRVKELHA